MSSPIAGQCSRTSSLPGVQIKRSDERFCPDSTAGETNPYCHATPHQADDTLISATLNTHSL